MLNTNVSPEFTQAALTKLNSVIDAGKRNAAATINSIMTEVPQDALVPSSALRFRASAGNVVELYTDLGEGKKNLQTGLHKHALDQAAERVSMPLTYLNHLLGTGEPWAAELAAKNLTDGWAHRDGKALVRIVDHQARGILSDRFRRLDSRPIVEALATAAQEIGLVPADGYALAVRNSLKMISSQVYWLTPTEPVLVGLSWTNSDYGAGKHALAVFIMRLMCTNGMTRDNVLSEIHLGRKLTDTVFSSDTFELDTKTSVSAVKDIVRGYLGPAKIEEQLAQLRVANETKLAPAAVSGILAHSGLTKPEQKKVQDAYTSADIEMMPAGPTVYRLANALSWVANDSTVDRGRKLDMMRMAGEILDRNGKVVKTTKVETVDAAA